MGCSRESQNLFKSGSFDRFWYLIKNFDKITYEDSFMPYVCKFFGHKPYQPDEEWEPDEWACKRCHNYITIQKK